jgi:hypothetical protein
MTPVKRDSYSYEVAAATPAEAATQLKKIIEYLADPSAFKYNGHLDSLLIYIDQAKA